MRISDWSSDVCSSDLVASLTHGITAIGYHRRNLMGQATAVKTVTDRIQTKLASVLTAMQIGDMTRQRIEHCQSIFSVLEEVLASEVALNLDGDQREAATGAVRQLSSDEHTTALPSLI